ncbi:phage portal protein [Secundilactobacillus pentosiphilus]|uniref:Phage portal protein n=1 Tax=Secundilactobacillus pentosiphilus TaxID=1714682 RepID=A0A1Z5IRM7_9LACO|nr:phage portal protein [Secundilactobacillus pentosiphilus]GAX04081.1 phage portal protein [Secundilactobacillus pentosiphilus]
MSDLTTFIKENNDSPSRFISGYADMNGDTKPFLAGDDIYLDDNDVARCSPDFDITQHLDELSLILDNYSDLRQVYHEKMRYYKGDHKAIKNRKKKLDSITDSNNKVVVNIAKNLVNTFTGYTNGKPVKITYTPENGDSTSSDAENVNNIISDVMNRTHANAVIYEASKKATIYGRSYIVAYMSQDLGETQPEMKFTSRSPEDCLIVYSNDNDGRPMFAMTFDYINSNYYGTLYTPTNIGTFDTKTLESLTSGDDSTSFKFYKNPFASIPVIELKENDERLGMVDDVLTLTDKLDKVMSEKIDENDYFNNAIFYTKGVKLFDDEQKAGFKHYHVIQVESAEGNQQPELGFLEKPDGDNVQEHTLTHLTNFIYTTAQVVNMSDPAFTDSTSSGEALARKMQPMQMHATVKYFQLEQSLQELLLLIFTQNGIGSIDNAYDLVQHTDIKFTPNIPESLLDESTVVKNLNGIVSLPRLLSFISSIDDIPQEVKAIEQTKRENAQMFASAGNPANQDNGNGNNDNSQGAQNNTSDNQPTPPANNQNNSNQQSGD